MSPCVHSVSPLECSIKLSDINQFWWDNIAVLPHGDKCCVLQNIHLSTTIIRVLFYYPYNNWIFYEYNTNFSTGHILCSTNHTTNHSENAGNVFPRRRLQRKLLVSDHGMHHGTCVTHVTWCMSGLLTRGGGENVPGIPGACETHNFTYLARGKWHKLPKPRVYGQTIRLFFAW